jgi:hypothetical protein
MIIVAIAISLILFIAASIIASKRNKGASDNKANA